jgi:hypothetical protein
MDVYKRNIIGSEDGREMDLKRQSTTSVLVCDGDTHKLSPLVESSQG